MTTTATPPTPPGPGSWTWADFGSWRFHLMLPQAFLLQVAHPVINAGVAEHSVYRSDPWGRARRSTELLWPVVYARPEAARRKAGELRERHRHIKGVDRHGNRYHAFNPEAWAWVHGTGFDATIRMHELFGTPPDDDARQQMFQEWRQIGLMLDVDPQQMPATEAQYWVYFHDMIEHRLELGEVARDLLSERYYREQPRPPVKWLPEPVWRHSLSVLGPLMHLNTIGTLPRRFRERFDIPWTARDERRFRRWCRCCRISWRLTPPPLRYIPLARRAMRDARRHPEAWQN